MQQRHPVTVFGSFKPFIGSGIEVRTWSFAQRLVRPQALAADPTADAEFAEPPFRISELVAHLRALIKRLESDENPETRLPSLDVDDLVYIDGTYVAEYRALLSRRPTDGEIEALMTDPAQAARHQLACRVASWGGEVFTSVFVHASLQGKTLYLEFSTYALTPTKRDYHRVDEIGGTGQLAVLRAMAVGTRNAPAVLTDLVRLRHVARWLVSIATAQRDRTLQARRGINVGAVSSVRESATRDVDGSYFQFRDVLKHSKIIERRLLAAVGEFLASRQVDVSEFQQRAMAILNHGVMVTGGEVKIEGSAIGVQASVGAPAPGGTDV
jgi:hypothetical protein